MCLDKPCEDGSVRLVGGESLFQGQVEVCVASTWSGVCDSQWDLATTQVLCQQLNYSADGIYSHALNSTWCSKDPMYSKPFLSSQQKELHSPREVCMDPIPLLSPFLSALVQRPTCLIAFLLEYNSSTTRTAHRSAYSVKVRLLAFP